MEVKLETAPIDKRFANTNQAKHCYAYATSHAPCAGACLLTASRPHLAPPLV